MQGFNHLFGILAGYQQAEVMAAGAIANQPDVERIQYAEHVFTHAACLR